MKLDMKLMVKPLATLSAVFLLAGAAFASDAARTTPSVKLPYSFTCIHCKLKMTIKTAADWEKPCWVCPCKAKAVDCQPKASPPKAAKKS